MVEYKIDMKMPWRVQKPKNQKYKFSAIGKQDQEIEYLSEVKNEVEDLISYLLIAGIFFTRIQNRPLHFL